MAGEATEDPVGEAIAEGAPALLAGKAEQPWVRMLVLAVLAGAFIAFGAVAALVAQASMGDGGAVRLLSGVAFSVGLMMVMIVGAQLFTGNTMLVLPVATGALAPGRMVAAWTVVWLGNLLGAVAIAALFSASGGLGHGVGDAAIALADGKLAKAPAAVFCSGILANMLVCLAVWMSMAARSVAAKVLAIVGPVTIFVAAGLEHSVANMSILPLGWFASGALDLSGMAVNLVFSTLGNIVGGAALALGIAYGHDALTRARPQ
ncbi:formate/nitrite transporter family protein [Sphingomonas sp. CJ20]